MLPLVVDGTVINPTDLLEFGCTSLYYENTLWVPKIHLNTNNCLVWLSSTDPDYRDFLLPVQIKCKNCIPFYHTEEDNAKLVLISKTVAESFGFFDTSYPSETLELKIHSYIEENDVLSAESLSLSFLPLCDQNIGTIQEYDPSLYPPADHDHMYGLLGIFLENSVVSVGSFIHLDCFGGNNLLFVYSINDTMQNSNSNNKQAFRVNSDTKINFTNSWYEAYHIFLSQNPQGAPSIQTKYQFPSLQDWSQRIRQEFGGYDDSIHRVTTSIHKCLQTPNNSRVNYPKCFLFTGIHGTGKTKIAKLIATHSRLPVWYIDGAQCMDSSGIEEETTKLVQEILSATLQHSPSILLIDQLENLCPPLQNSSAPTSLGSIESHISSLLKSFIDYIHHQEQTNSKNQTFTKRKVFVLATCTDALQGSLDASFLRSRRFDQIIELNLPSIAQRKQILQILTRSLPLESNFTNETLCEQLSRITHGFVASDLEAVCNDTLIRVIQQKLETSTQTEVLCSYEDFQQVVKTIRPANLAEHIKPQLLGNSVCFDEFGGLEDIISQLKASVIHGIEKRELYSNLGVSPPSGLLFYGESGTGKTQMVQALANESGLNLISIQGPELISPVVGQSEKNISNLFYRARASAPCILFLDQIDALAVTRGIGDSSNRVRERTLSCLLTEMDGVTQTKDMEGKSIIVIGVTQNRDCLDPAILRPGRLDLHIRFPLPDLVGRKQILQKVLVKTPLSESVSITELAEKTNNYTGAELRNICQEAVMICLRENIHSETVSKEHFDIALKLCGSKLSREVQSKKIPIKEEAKPKEPPLLFSFKSIAPPIQTKTEETAKIPITTPVFSFKWDKSTKDVS